MTTEKKPRRKSKREMFEQLNGHASPATSAAEPMPVLTPEASPAAVAGEERVEVDQVEDLDKLQAVAVQDQPERIPLTGFQSDLFATPEERRLQRRLDKLRRELDRATRERNKTHEKLRRLFRRYDRLVTEVGTLERRFGWLMIAQK